MGALWENYIIMERIKLTDYTAFYGNRYFWRTYQGSEIDYIEEQDGQLKAYECKWGVGKRIDPPKEWLNGYPTAPFMTITPDNFLDFLLR